MPLILWATTIFAVHDSIQTDLTSFFFNIWSDVCFRRPSTMISSSCSAHYFNEIVHKNSLFVLFDNIQCRNDCKCWHVHIFSHVCLHSYTCHSMVCDTFEVKIRPFSSCHWSFSLPCFIRRQQMKYKWHFESACVNSCQSWKSMTNTLSRLFYFDKVRNTFVHWIISISFFMCLFLSSQ
jgi:hypothetical protein